MCSAFQVPVSDTQLPLFVGRLVSGGFHAVRKRFFKLAESPVSGPLVLSPPDLKRLLLGPLREPFLLVWGQ